MWRIPFPGKSVSMGRGWVFSGRGNDVNTNIELGIRGLKKI